MNDMSRVILFLGFLSLLVFQGAFAEEVLSVSFTVYRNDTVELDGMRVIEGKPTFYINPGRYMVQVAGEDGRTLYFDEDLRVDFLLFTNPPTEVNRSRVSLRIPYDPGMRYFRVYRDMELIFEAEIKVCDGDGVCDEGFESSLSCPADCPPDEEDGFCVDVRDGVCDPDCYEGVDTDCSVGEDVDEGDVAGVSEEHDEGGSEEDDAAGDDLFVYVLGGVLVVLVLLLRRHIRGMFGVFFFYLKPREK